MAEEKVQTIEKALAELRGEKKRKFIQTIDLIVNLKDFDVRRENVNTFITLPNAGAKKVCGFLSRKVDGVDVILESEFKKYNEENEIKRLAKKYDFFIAVAPMMPKIATKFGRVFGPIGKMPSPQAGIMPNDDEASVKAMVQKMKKMVRIRSKEKSLKIPVGKEDMSDEELKQNIDVIISSLEKVLPKNKQNIKDILVKLTMSKPIKIMGNRK